MGARRARHLTRPGSSAIARYPRAVFPLRDTAVCRRFPLAVWALVALNVAAWALLEGLGTQPALARAVEQAG